MLTTQLQSENYYTEKLFSLIRQNKHVWEIISTAENLAIPNWYVAAGCIAQTVWNHLHGFNPESFISDIDFIYFDDNSLTYESENAVINRMKANYSHIPIQLDIKNQARVHFWYKEHFGYSIPPYNSVEESIQTFPTTATSIGIKSVEGQLMLYAPFGLRDLFTLSVKPNKKQITREIYQAKINKWKTHWNKLIFYEW